MPIFGQLGEEEEEATKLMNAIVLEGSKKNVAWKFGQNHLQILKLQAWLKSYQTISILPR